MEHKRAALAAAAVGGVAALGIAATVVFQAGILPAAHTRGPIHVHVHAKARPLAAHRPIKAETRPRVAPEQRPYSPEGLRQAAMHGLVARVVASGAWLNTAHARLSFRLASPMRSARLQAQVELRPLAQPFSGHPTSTSSVVVYHGSPVASSIDVWRLHDGAYHWRVRVHDLKGPNSRWATPQGAVLRVYLGHPAAPTVTLATPHLAHAWVATPRVALRWAPVADASGISGYSFTLTRDRGAQASRAWPLPTTGVTLHAGGDGTWYFSVRAMNRAHTWGPPAQVVVHVDTARPRLAGIAVPRRAINPHHTPTIARMRLAHTARIVVDVVNAAGHVVRSISTHVHPAGYDMTIGWDGLDARGRAAPNGTYALRIAAINRAGVAWRTTRQLRVEGSPPGFAAYGLTQTGSYNPYNNGLDGPEAITATLDEPAHVTIDLMRDQRVIRAWTTNVLNTGQVVTATWDGTTAKGEPLGSATYGIRATAVDEAGNRTVRSLGSIYLDLRRIVVSLNQQRVWAMDGDRVLMTSLVTTGGPELPTPTGDFQIIDRESPFTFHSPFPTSSPYWYPDSPTNFALLFQINGYFIHDAPWRSYYGPGSNSVDGIPGANTTGTHGCVNVPYSQMAWLFNWAAMYTPVQVRQDWAPS